MVQTQALSFGSMRLPVHVDRECFILHKLFEWVLDDVNEAIVLVFVPMKEYQFSENLIDAHCA